MNKLLAAFSFVLFSMSAQAGTWAPQNSVGGGSGGSSAPTCYLLALSQKTDLAIGHGVLSGNLFSGAIRYNPGAGGTTATTATVAVNCGADPSCPAWSRGYGYNYLYYGVDMPVVSARPAACF